MESWVCLTSEPMLSVDPMYLTCTMHPCALESQDVEHYSMHVGHHTCHSSARKASGHLYKETEAQIHKADMENSILPEEGRKPYDRSVSLALYTSLLQPLLSLWAAPGCCFCSFLGSVTLGNLICVHDLNILMNTKPYSSSDFSLS